MCIAVIGIQPEAGAEPDDGLGESSRVPQSQSQIQLGRGAALIENEDAPPGGDRFFQITSAPQTVGQIQQSRDEIPLNGNGPLSRFNRLVRQPHHPQHIRQNIVYVGAPGCNTMAA